LAVSWFVGVSSFLGSTGVAIAQDVSSLKIAPEDDLGRFQPGADSLSKSILDSSQVSSGTAVDVPSQLLRLYQRGGVPRSMAELQLLEQQQQRVTRLADSCTVSVTIGPAQGCGVIITSTGYVLTAAHVAMRPGKDAILTLAGGRQVRATTLGMYRGVDAGLIKIDPGQDGSQPWPHASLGSSDNLMSGMWCIATGHPGGYTEERGFVTRVGRILSVQPDSLVTDCALIGGDSGGPLFDIAGKLIAIHSRIGNDVADNLHVPIDHYDQNWDRLARSESWGVLPGFKPVLGVSGNQSIGVAQVVAVNPGTPAEAAGFRKNDIVEEFGDALITDFDSLKRAVADTMPGERVVVWVSRGGQRMKLFVEIGRDESG
jgi:serine protease Do